LEAEGLAVRVVSLPCWEVFEAQPAAYRHSVLPKDLPTVSVEAGATLGWERYAHRTVGLDRFGASAPFADIYKNLGFTAGRIADVVKDLLR
jgi:transketolase